jgi:nitrite reductase/ring-hydroxylating ferredoxin subunit
MFYPLIRKQALYDGLCLPRQAGDKALLVIHRRGQTFITDRFCPHQQFLLDNAVIDEHLMLTCPRHRFHYRLGDGECAEGAGFTLEHYHAVWRGEELGVDL